MKKVIQLLFLLLCMLQLAAAAMGQVQPRPAQQVFDPATGSYGKQITGVSGNGRTLATVNGPLTQGDCIKPDANGNLIDSGAACGGGGITLPGTPNVVYSFTALGDSCTASTGTIADLSGSGNGATMGSTPPSCIGTGLDFNNSTNSSVSLPASLNGDLGFCANVTFRLYGQSGPSSGPSFDFLMASANINAAGASWLVAGSDAIYSPFSFANGSLRTISNKNQSEAGNHTICWILGQGGQASTSDRFFVDGAETAYQQSGASGGLQVASNYVFGHNNFSSPGFYDGQLNYFVGWAAQPTAAQMKAASYAITAASAAKGVQTQPPTSLTPSLVMDGIGDSITDGFGATTPWTANLSVTGAYTIVNNGFYGISAQSQMGQARWRDATYCRTGFSKSFVIIFDGTNDITNGVTALATLGYLMADASILQAAGCQVAIATMLSRTGQDTTKNILNGRIRTNAIDGGYIVADFASDPNLGADNAFSNLTYFNADGVHPTQAGQALIAAAASNVINAYGFGAASASNPTSYSSNTVTMTSADRYATIIPTGAATATLPDCIGVTGATYQVFNASAGANTITFSGKASEAITGSATLAQNLAARFQATLISPSAAGCGWQRIQ